MSELIAPDDIARMDPKPSKAILSITPAPEIFQLSFSPSSTPPHGGAAQLPATTAASSSWPQPQAQPSLGGFSSVGDILAVGFICLLQPGTPEDRDLGSERQMVPG